MPHDHEGGLTHDHPGGEVAHTHDDVTTEAAPVREPPVAHRTDTRAEYPHGVRGGFALGAILTGVAVAVGSVLLLASLIGGIVVAVGADEAATTEEITRLGWGAAIGLIVAQFLAYLWGGYTSGRMARGLGWLNGLMVPIAALVLAVLIGLVIRAFGAETGVNVPYGTREIPVGIDVERFRDIGLVAGIGSLLAMLLGGLLGGILGSRWHDKLEARAGEDEHHLRAA